MWSLVLDFSAQSRVPVCHIRSGVLLWSGWCCGRERLLLLTWRRPSSCPRLLVPRVVLFRLSSRCPSHVLECSAGCPASLMHTRRLAQVVHLVVAGLNYWYSGGRFGEMELLQREPSKHHLALYARIKLLVESEGPVHVDSLPKAGRRFPELAARIGELSDALTRMGHSSDPYAKAYAGCEAPKDDDAHHQRWNLLVEEIGTLLSTWTIAFSWLFENQRYCYTTVQMFQDCRSMIAQTPWQRYVVVGMTLTCWWFTGSPFIPLAQSEFLGHTRMSLAIVR